MRSPAQSLRSLACGTLLFMLMLGGCPLQTFTADPNSTSTGDAIDSNSDGAAAGDNTIDNVFPAANAGQDRKVLRGADVTLTGSASDADGDPLTLLWEQTGGASVALSGAVTETLSFTAPDSLGDLTFALTATDDHGNADTDSVVVSVIAAPAFLYVANNDNGRVTSHSTSDLDGEIVPATSLEPGAATSLFQVRSILVTPDGMLFASRQNGGIVAYDDALSADETIAASRVIDGNATLLEAPIALAYDPAADTLYVGNADADSGVLAFSNATATSFDGDVAPARVFAPSDRFPHSGSIRMTIDALWIDADGGLYASDTSGLNVNSSRILYWREPGSASGETPADREITSSAFGNIEDIFVDESGMLYVVDGSNQIHVFKDAAALDGDETPDVTITIDGTPTPQFHGIAIDSDGVGYVSDRENDAIYALVGIAGLNGSGTPDTTLEGFDTRLGGPRQLWIYQP